jgi:hypothetical protein
MEQITLNVNTGVNIKTITKYPMFILTIESKDNKYNSFLIKNDNKETILGIISQNETKQLKQTISTNVTLKLISDNELSTDKILINYFILKENNNISNNTHSERFDNNEVEEEEEEDEEFDEEEESLEDQEDDVSLEGESDLAQVANDLWEECEAEFENEQFLGKKRKL